MSTHNGTAPAESTDENAQKSTDPRSPEEIEAEIAQQREELAATVDQLQARLDVKSRAQRRLSDARDQATTADGKPRPELVAAAVGVVALLGVVIWRRR